MLICAVNTCFIALGDDSLCGHYCTKRRESVMTYSNVIIYRNKELVVVSTELQGNSIQNYKLMRIVAKHKIAYFLLLRSRLSVQVCIVIFLHTINNIS